VSRTGFEPV